MFPSKKKVKNKDKRQTDESSSLLFFLVVLLGDNLYLTSYHHRAIPSIREPRKCGGFLF